MLDLASKLFPKRIQRKRSKLKIQLPLRKNRSLKTLNLHKQDKIWQNSLSKW